MPITITHIETHDIRFPTSRTLDGSDTMNQSPDYTDSLQEPVVQRENDEWWTNMKEVFHTD